MSFVHIEELEETATDVSKEGTDVAAFLAMIEEVRSCAPDEAWAELPRDLAAHFDDYQFGRRTEQT